MEEKRKNIGIEILPSLHKRLKQRAVDQDRQLWAILQEAIEQYLDGTKDREPDPDVEMLLEFKRISSSEDYEALRQNIVVFLRDARRILDARRRKGA